MLRYRVPSRSTTFPSSSNESAIYAPKSYLDLRNQCFYRSIVPCHPKHSSRSLSSQCRDKQSSKLSMPSNNGPLETDPGRATPAIGCTRRPSTIHSRASGFLSSYLLTHRGKHADLRESLRFYDIAALRDYTTKSLEEDTRLITFRGGTTPTRRPRTSSTSSTP